MSARDMDRIGCALRDGRATIEGRASLGQAWPDEPHAWIVTLHDEMRTVHVPCSVRPTWRRYLKAVRP